MWYAKRTNFYWFVCITVFSYENWEGWKQWFFSVISSHNWINSVLHFRIGNTALKTYLFLYSAWFIHHLKKLVDWYSLKQNPLSKESEYILDKSEANILDVYWVTIEN